MSYLIKSTEAVQSCGIANGQIKRCVKASLIGRHKQTSISDECALSFLQPLLTALIQQYYLID